MKHGAETAYGETFAPIYDALYQQRDDLDVVCGALERLAAGGPVLEFGVGTGRIALPLARRGLSVTGMDSSPAMLAQLRAKPDAERVAALLGDCASTRVPGEFALVLIAFSTIFLLAEQEAQVLCFQNAARHLRPGGVFVVEGFVHDRSMWRANQELVTTGVSEHGVSLRCGILDPVAQRIETQHVELGPSGVTMRRNQLRFIYPSEMDLMARLAGLQLIARWGGWDGAAFGASSGSQIAVYQRPALS